MTGPENYREAERLLEEPYETNDRALVAYAAAQVHATLALAAATADPFGHEDHWKAVLA